MIWIIGAGAMAREYAKVLNALKEDFICIGRSEKGVNEFIDATGGKAITGGLDAFLSGNPERPKASIVASNLNSLAPNTISLMKYGIRQILCEKPGFQFPEEIESVLSLQKETNSQVFIAYNRRFYASVLAAEEIIEKDGGLRSFNFEFTEWGHVISAGNYSKEDLANWFYANSTHVVDLAFFLGGKPSEFCTYSKSELNWHKPSSFIGAGITDKGALFNYQANWDAPGRWAVELLTSKHRIYLKPMEQLQMQDKGSVKVYGVDIDDHLDKEFKPGLYLETKAFLEGNKSRLCSLQQQSEHLKTIYQRIIEMK